MRKTHFIVYTFFLLGIISCKNKPVINEAQILHDNQNLLTTLIIHDVFNPPVASRIYAYTSLASYEALRFEDSSKYPSIIVHLKGFHTLPSPEKNKKYDFGLVATAAFFTMAKKVIFSVDSLAAHENIIYERYKKNTAPDIFSQSVEFGKSIGNVILQRAMTDNYPQTRGKPRFTGSNDPGKWRPTPPDYLDGVEYCWGTMKTFALDSSSQFAPPPPIPYSEDTTGEYFRQNVEVYRAGINLTEEQKQIAKYWDDNPFVIEHSGHMMFANKKITPGGHWMGITRIACLDTKANAIKTAQAYALVSLAMFDAFICCWQEKYRSMTIRPVSVIDEKIDPNWMPFLQTPPFPEYPSGHSTITAAAATVLTHLFGDHFKFEDTSDLEYIGMKRNFPSFFAAANEASVSRFYGGIHYLNSVRAGADQGKSVGEFIIKKLKLK